MQDRDVAHEERASFELFQLRVTVDYLPFMFHCWSHATSQLEVIWQKSFIAQHKTNPNNKQCLRQIVATCSNKNRIQKRIQDTCQRMPAIFLLIVFMNLNVLVYTLYAPALHSLFIPKLTIPQRENLLSSAWHMSGPPLSPGQVPVFVPLAQIMLSDKVRPVFASRIVVYCNCCFNWADR